VELLNLNNEENNYIGIVFGTMFK